MVNILNSFKPINKFFSCERPLKNINFVRFFVCLFVCLFSNLAPFTFQELLMLFNFSRPLELFEKCLVSHLCLASWFILYCKGKILLSIKNSIRCGLKHLPGAMFINMKDWVALFINPREISYLILRSCCFSFHV